MLKRIDSFFSKKSKNKNAEDGNSEVSEAAPTDQTPFQEACSCSSNLLSPSDSCYPAPPLSEKTNIILSSNHDPAISEEKFFDGKVPCQPKLKTFPKVLIFRIRYLL